MTASDPSVGVIYLNNRHHDPTTGIFVSVDPLVTITGEPYVYVGGNPITYSDPSGLIYDNPDHSYSNEVRDWAMSIVWWQRLGYATTTEFSNGVDSPWGFVSVVHDGDGNFHYYESVLDYAWEDTGNALTGLDSNYTAAPAAYRDAVRKSSPCTDGSCLTLSVDFVIDDALVKLLEAARARAQGRKPPFSPLPAGVDPLLSPEFVAGIQCAAGIQYAIATAGAAQAGAAPRLTSEFGLWVADRGSKAVVNQVAGTSVFPTMTDCVNISTSEL